VHDFHQIKPKEIYFLLFYVSVFISIFIGQSFHEILATGDIRCREGRRAVGGG
jgi:hypothetical protein